MLTAFFIILLISVCFKLAGLALKLAWGMTRIVFTIVLFPIILIGLALAGLIYLSILILLIVGAAMLIRRLVLL